MLGTPVTLCGFIWGREGGSYLTRTSSCDIRLAHYVVNDAGRKGSKEDNNYTDLMDREIMKQDWTYVFPSTSYVKNNNNYMGNTLARCLSAAARGPSFLIPLKSPRVIS